MSAAVVDSSVVRITVLFPAALQKFDLESTALADEVAAMTNTAVATANTVVAWKYSVVAELNSIVAESPGRPVLDNQLSSVVDGKVRLRTETSA
jgi:hypothetical protein